MKTKPLPIQEIKEHYSNLFYTTLDVEVGYKFERLTECLLFTLQSKTGLRISDVLDLKYTNVVYKGLDTYFELILKKTKRELVLPMDRLLLKMIQDYKEYCILEFNEANEQMFYNYNSGKTFTYMWANKRVNQLNKSGVLGKVYDNVGTHSIRKGLAEYLFSKKGIRTTQYLLGHKSMLTTEIYLKLDEKQHLKDLQEVL
jgi:integrase